MNVSALLAANGRKYADKPALVSGEASVTFAQWNETANLWACKLRERGVQAGDRVVMLMPNCPEFGIFYMAVVRCGAIIVPINARSTQEEVRHISEHAGAPLSPDLAALLVQAYGRAIEIHAGSMSCPDRLPGRSASSWPFWKKTYPTCCASLPKLSLAS